MKTVSEKTKKERASKKLVTGSALAAIAAAGLTLGALFSSPSDLLNKDFLLTPPFEMTDVMLNEDNSDGGPDIAAENEQEKKQRGIRAALRKLFWKLPVGVRAFAGVPVWAIGRVLLALLLPIFQKVLPSALMSILKYLCIAGLIFAALILPVKALFPDVPLKKLVTGRRIAFSAVIAVLFGAVGVILELFWPEAMKTYELIETGLISVIVVLVGVGILKIRKDRKKTLIDSARADAEDELISVF